MKKLIILFAALFAFNAKAQEREPSADEQLNMEILILKRKVDRIQLNLEKYNDLYTNGIQLHCAGFMTSLIAVTGYKFNYMNKKQFENTLIIAGAFHLSGICVTWYSHKFILKASIQ